MGTARYIVIERDDRICQQCNGPGYQVHHIVPKSRFGRKNKQLAERKENMILLCTVCHQKAATKLKRRWHLEILRQRHGYEYTEQPWIGVLGEA